MKCAVTSVLLVLAGTCFASDVQVIEQIVAKVNNEIITKGELDKALRDTTADLTKQQLTPDRMKELLKEAGTNVLRDKIDQMLLVQKAKELSIDVDSDVSKRLAQLQVEAKRMGNCSECDDPEKFQQYIREGTGMSFEDFKQQMKDNFMTGEVIRREVGSRISISKAEQLKYYEEHKNEFVREEQVLLREILVSTDGKDAKGAALAEKKAKDLSARARKGENFGKLAHDNSDSETARNDGELAPFKRADLKKELADIVFAQSKGYVTEPVKQSNGFLILKVEEHYTPGLQPFESVQNEVMEKIYMPRMQPALREYMTRLRKDAFLEIRAGYSDSGAAPGKDTSWRDPAKLTPQTVTKQEVAMHIRRRRLLFMVPVPGTSKSPRSWTTPPLEANPRPEPPAGSAAPPAAPSATPNQTAPASPQK
jgi:parvulin-like peptidyl-prolyl isomerase